MKIDYKKELEVASKGMIMIHDPKLLIKLIVRMIVRKLGIKHAAMILYDPQKDIYILNISQGERGVRIPPGFTRFDKNSPVVRLFYEKEFNHLIASRNAIILEDINRLIWRESVMDAHSGSDVHQLLHKVGAQMHMLNTVACVPAYYQRKLMAILLLGEKRDESKFDQDELDFFTALASDAAMAIRNAQLFEGMRRESERNRRQFLQTIIVLGSTIEAKDSYTRGHTDRVTHYALAIARHMASKGGFEFSSDFLEGLYIGSMLHDIGKIAIPEAILNKTEPLTVEEFKIVQQHTVKGFDILLPLSLSSDCINGVKYHHERFDGGGYPEGLKGDEIPISATIIAVADTFDAMTSDRPYRKGLGEEVAINEIKSNVGTQFNPAPVKTIVDLYEKGLL